MRAIIYSRYSTDNQAESSIEDQIRVCQTYAADRSWSVAAQFSDRGISGAALGNRPGANAALEAARSGDILLLMELSRLSRSQDLAPLISRLRHRGVRVVGIQDGYDSDSRTARMQAGMSGMMSEEYRAMIGDRTRSALDMRARQGRATGGKAYGNVPVVQEIFARIAAGEGMRDVCNDLNARRIPSPGAAWKQRSSPRGQWYMSTLHELLHNERYIGRVIWNRSRWSRDPDTGIRHRRERPPSEWVVTECEPVVDMETWRLVQARFSIRRPFGGQPRYLLSGLLECGLCRAKLTIMGGSQHRYICGAHHAGGPAACSNRTSFPRRYAEHFILQPIVQDMLSDEAIEKGVQFLREERLAAEHRPDPSRLEVKALERMVREGLLSADTAAPALALARQRASDAQPLPWPSPKLWRETVTGLRDNLLGQDVGLARAALQGLIGVVPCTPVQAGKFVRAEVMAKEVLLATGTGSWVGSGGPLVTQILIPTSSRGRDVCL